jgi:hypothetical protein
MLKPSFRFFIIPLGAVCTLASLSAQNVSPRARAIPVRCSYANKWSIAAPRAPPRSV